MPIITKGGKIMDKEKKDSNFVSSVTAILGNTLRNKEYMKTELGTKKDISYNKELHAELKKVAKSKDINDIISVERVLIISDIASNKENQISKGTETSLTAALIDLEQGAKMITAINDKEYYKQFEDTFSKQPKNRINGLPKDSVHQFINSHITRINNSIISPKTSNYEKPVLMERVENLKVTKEEYMKLQAKTLDMKLPEKNKSKEKERD